MDFKPFESHWNQENAILVDRFHIFGPVKNPAGNDLFNIEIKKILDMKKSFRQGKGPQLSHHTTQLSSSVGKLNDLGRIDLSDFSLAQDERLFLFVILKSDRERQALISIFARCLLYKVWINGKFEGMGSVDFCNIFDTLAAGDNAIFIEISHTTEQNFICIRLSDDEYEAKSEHFTIGRNNYLCNASKIGIVDKGPMHEDERYYEFMLYPNDRIRIGPNTKILISVENSRSDMLDTLEVDFYSLIKYDLNNLRAKLTDNPAVNFKMTVHLLDNNLYFQNNIIIADNLKRYSEEIIKRFDRISNALELSEDDRINITGRVWNLQDAIPSMISSEISVLHRLLQAYQNKLHLFHIMKLPGAKYVFYKSRLDDQIEKYLISIPVEYDPAKKYPLIVHISTGRYSEESLLRASYVKEPVIFADISGRGVTGGSYIGESSFLEVLERITYTFSINRDRVCLTGYSSGAFACWSLAQAYPHLFAAIAPITGIPYAQNMLNLSNMGIHNFSSQEDLIYEEAYKIPTRLLENFDNYTGVLMEKGVHVALCILNYNSSIFDLLLSRSLKRFPMKVLYRTERERHNRAYWVQINGIESGRNYARIEAEIIDEHIIRISEENVKGITLTIPGQISKDVFTITLNNIRSYTFRQYKEDTVSFLKTNESFTCTGNFNIPGTRSSKGMGLLDIYMESMKIVIPDKYDNEKELEVVKNIAGSFSKPCTEGFDTTVYVDYPVANCSEVDQDQLASHNLILIGINENNELISRIRSSLPIKLHKHGYKYNGTLVHTKYCILQICPSPFSPLNNVLTIYANDLAMLKNCIPANKITMPKYVDGLDEVLNSEAIIYDEQGYSKICSWSDDSEFIETYKLSSHGN